MEQNIILTSKAPIMSKVEGFKSGLWLYCIIENNGEMKWEHSGIHGSSPIYTIKGGDFAAVVSREPLKKYPLVRETLIAHQQVNELVMQTHHVLPVRFCTMAEDEEKVIEEALLPKAEEYRQQLSKITHRVEYGLRLRWKDLDRVFCEIGQTDEVVRQKKEQILKLPEEKRREMLIDIGHLVQEAIKKKNEAMTQTIMKELASMAVESKKNNTLGDAMILNAAFLIDVDKQDRFDININKLEEKYKEELQFKYLGPIPPFNFVEIVIRWKEETG